MGRTKTRQIALEPTLETMTPGETEDHRRWGGHDIICEKCQRVIEGMVKFHRCTPPKPGTVRVNFPPRGSRLGLERDIEAEDDELTQHDHRYGWGRD